MKFPFPSNMSRLFRIFLIIASVLFACFFVYQNASRTTRSNSIASSQYQDRSSAMGRAHARRVSTRLHPQSDVNGGGLEEKRDIVTSSLNMESIAHHINVSHEDLSSSGVDDLTQVIDDIKRKKLAILEQTKEKIRQFRVLKKETTDMPMSVKRLAEAKFELLLSQEKIDYTDEESEGESKEGMKYRSKKPIFIVVLARMRTGSTLLGEIFNHNPSLFYLYEPLISLDFGIRAGQLDVSQHSNVSSNLLMEYSNCRFPEEFTKRWLSWQGKSTRSTKLAPLCQLRNNNCSNIAMRDIEFVCRTTHRRVCMKTIRSDLDYFRPLVEAGVNVKIIHLVRDPRGTTNSRRLYYIFQRPKLPGRVTDLRQRLKGKLDALGLLGDYPDHVVHTIPRLCQWTRDSVLQARKKPAWLHNRYKLVRYEDFALDPLRTARDIYDFVDIDFPREVMQWIVSNTRTDDARSSKLFSTHKNSSETASRWRYSLRPAQVHQVETICREAMGLLGYRTVTSFSQLTNDSVSLLDKLPID